MRGFLETFVHSLPAVLIPPRWAPGTIDLHWHQDVATLTTHCDVRYRDEFGDAHRRRLKFTRLDVIYDPDSVADRFYESLHDWLWDISGPARAWGSGLWLEMEW